MRTSLFELERIDSLLRTRSLDVRDRCGVRFHPNIRRKVRRDIDGSLGMSALRFGNIMLCVAKSSESFVVECRHNRNCIPEILSEDSDFSSAESILSLNMNPTDKRTAKQNELIATLTEQFQSLTHEFRSVSERLDTKNH